MAPIETRDSQPEARWREQERTYGDSAIQRIFGLRLQVVGSGETLVTCDQSDGGGNRMGTAAGGLLAQLVDSAVVQAARTLLEPDDRTVTVELKVNFLRPGRTDRPLTAHGRVLDMGRTLAVGTAEVSQDGEDMIGVGLVTVRISRAQGHDHD